MAPTFAAAYRAGRHDGHRGRVAKRFSAVPAIQGAYRRGHNIGLTQWTRRRIKENAQCATA